MYISSVIAANMADPFNLRERTEINLYGYIDLLILNFRRSNYKQCSVFLGQKDMDTSIAVSFVFKSASCCLLMDINCNKNK